MPASVCGSECWRYSESPPPLLSSAPPGAGDTDSLRRLAGSSSHSSPPSQGSQGWLRLCAWCASSTSMPLGLPGPTGPPSASAPAPAPAPAPTGPACSSSARSPAAPWSVRRYCSSGKRLRANFSAQRRTKSQEASRSLAAVLSRGTAAPEGSTFLATRPQLLRTQAHMSSRRWYGAHLRRSIPASRLAVLASKCRLAMDSRSRILTRRRRPYRYCAYGCRGPLQHGGPSAASSFASSAVALSKLRTVRQDASLYSCCSTSSTPHLLRHRSSSRRY
mmetsp:Transcript_28455/g.92215  ORF Transcript_28455/g.92215 Transcript_28455/m.92215 type:complete len:276 (+) Transcript_28455:2663-3490(+)